jgi:[NiFe] hydrogenase large subunit/hydrogenase large subunit
MADVEQLLTDTRRFVDLVYVPDALAIASFYEDWLGVGVGLGSFLSFGDFPTSDLRGSPLLLPRGRIMHGDLDRAGQVDEIAVAESIAHSWYTYQAGDAAFLHPGSGETTQRYDGPPLPFASLEGSQKYSWLKAPRYAEEPQEVGPLARMLVGYAESREDIKPVVDDHLARLGLEIDAFAGTLGRLAARAIEARILASRLDPWFLELQDNLAAGDLAIADITRWDPGSWPSEAQGVSIGESPRGALGHWVTVKDGTIRSYQVVDGTTWNASPRDDKGLRGALEEALLGTPVADPTRPVEILRTVHSFDPCAACAVHARGSRAGGSIDIRIAGGGDR